MKRITVILSNRELRELKRIAYEQRHSVSEIVDEFLADGLHRANAPRRSAPSLPVFDMGEPLVNIDDRGQLYEAMR